MLTPPRPARTWLPVLRVEYLPHHQHALRVVDFTVTTAQVIDQGSPIFGTIGYALQQTQPKKPKALRGCYVGLHAGQYTYVGSLDKALVLHLVPTPDGLVHYPVPAVPEGDPQSTEHHIARVRQLCTQVAYLFLQRGAVHDASKLSSPEKEMFEAVTAKLRGLTFMSDEYKASLKELGPALDHHYAANSHHPQHYPNGVEGMDLLDVFEMFLDWWAAGERHANGNLFVSLFQNRERFGLSDQLYRILWNTAQRLSDQPVPDEFTR